MLLATNVFLIGGAVGQGASPITLTAGATVLAFAVNYYFVAIDQETRSIDQIRQNAEARRQRERFTRELQISDQRLLKGVALAVDSSFSAVPETLKQFADAHNAGLSKLDARVRILEDTTKTRSTRPGEGTDSKEQVDPDEAQRDSRSRTEGGGA